MYMCGAPAATVDIGLNLRFGRRNQEKAHYCRRGRDKDFLLTEAGGVKNFRMRIVLWDRLCKERNVHGG